MKKNILNAVIASLITSVLYRVAGRGYDWDLYEMLIIYFSLFWCLIAFDLKKQLFK